MFCAEDQVTFSLTIFQLENNFLFQKDLPLPACAMVHTKY